MNASNWTDKLSTEDCPRWQVQADNFLYDPITVQGGVGGEMLDIVRQRHIARCGLCGTGSETAPVGRAPWNEDPIDFISLDEAVQRG